MALFRPYEQGKTDPESAKPSRRGGATRADLVEQVTEPEAVVTETVVVEERRTQDAPARQASAAKKTRQPAKKGTRTPTRAEAEAARMARLHPTLSPKEQKKARREAEREARLRSMDAVEQSPARTLLRDHVDAHFSPTELTMPIMFVMIVCMFAFQRNFTVQAWLSWIMMALVLVFLVFFFLTWRGFRRIAEERGVDPRVRGLKMYMVNRMMSMRGLRRPSPRVGRGDSY